MATVGRRVILFIKNLTTVNNVYCCYTAAVLPLVLRAHQSGALHALQWSSVQVRDSDGADASSHMPVRHLSLCLYGTAKGPHFGFCML